MAAGLKPWPKLWSNLRRSAAIDLASTFPAFAVSEWLGRSPAVSEAFYLRITPQLEADVRKFQRLQAARKPAQQMHAQGCMEPQTQKSPNPQPAAMPPVASRGAPVQECITPPRGVEPLFSD